MDFYSVQILKVSACYEFIPDNPELCSSVIKSKISEVYKSFLSVFIYMSNLQQVYDAQRTTTGCFCVSVKHEVLKVWLTIRASSRLGKGL